MKNISLLFAGLAVAAISGCSSLSTVNPRAMTSEDVISMTEAGVGADVITRQIEATRSKFELSPEEIVRLKNAGVADDVLTAMIDSGEKAPYWNEYGLSPYDFWNGYYDPVAYGYYPPYYIPYVVYRTPGLVGRFHSYYPLTLRPWNRYSPYYFQNPYDPETAPRQPDGGIPGNPGHGGTPESEK